ncbi:MAG: M56 family metallopeptidase [Cytophagales bacterium]|nr:M56 family metallopeptidase [Cytophagales bacterium]
MELVNTYSLYIVTWLATYLLHSTLIYIAGKVALNIFSSNETKELLLRFAIFGPMFTSVIQRFTEFGYSLNDSTGSATTTLNVLRIFPAQEFIVETNWPTLLVAVWLLVSFTLLVRHVLLIRSFLKSVKPLVTLTSRQLERLNQHKDILVRARRVDFVVSSKSISPFVCGANRIVIPELVFNNLDDSEFRSILAHEVSHLVRRDWYWLQVYKCSEMIFFFQPLNRILLQDLISTIESICDSRAIRLTNDRKSLASSILQIAAWKNAATDNLVSGLAFHSTFLTKRIDNILDAKHTVRSSTKWKVNLTLILLTITCITAIPGFSLEKKNKRSQIPDTYLSASPSDSIPAQGEEYMLEIPLPVNVEIDVPIEIDIDLENEIELNPTQ